MHSRYQILLRGVLQGEKIKGGSSIFVFYCILWPNFWKSFGGIDVVPLPPTPPLSIYATIKKWVSIRHGGSLQPSKSASTKAETLNILKLSIHSLHFKNVETSFSTFWNCRDFPNMLTRIAIYPPVEKVSTYQDRPSVVVSVSNSSVGNVETSVPSFKNTEAANHPKIPRI